MGGGAWAGGWSQTAGGRRQDEKQRLHFLFLPPAVCRLPSAVCCCRLPPALIAFHGEEITGDNFARARVASAAYFNQIVIGREPGSGNSDEKRCSRAVGSGPN